MTSIDSLRASIQGVTAFSGYKAPGCRDTFETKAAAKNAALCQAFMSAYRDLVPSDPAFGKILYDRISKHRDLLAELLSCMEEIEKDEPTEKPDHRDIFRRIELNRDGFRLVNNRDPSILLLGRCESLLFLGGLAEELRLHNPRLGSRTSWAAVFCDDTVRYEGMRPIPVQLERYLDVA